MSLSDRDANGRKRFKSLEGYIITHVTLDAGGEVTVWGRRTPTQQARPIIKSSHVHFFDGEGDYFSESHG